MYKAYRERCERLRIQAAAMSQRNDVSTIVKIDDIEDEDLTDSEDSSDPYLADVGDFSRQKWLELIRTSLKLDQLGNTKEYDSRSYIGLMTMIHTCSENSEMIADVVECLIDCKFVDLAIKMLKYFHKLGLLSCDSSIWTAADSTLAVCVDYSDASISFATECLEKGMVSLMAEYVSYKPYLDDLEDEKVADLMESTLTILLNVSKVPESASYFEKANMKARLEPFLTSTDDMLRALGTMILVNIIKEEENALLEDTGAIAFIVENIKEALIESDRRCDGFSTTELTECLGRMAVNDTNKCKILEEDALPAFVEMMQYEDENEQYAAARTIWTLSFDKEVKKKIIEEPNCLHTLQQLAEKGSKRVSKMARGALWIIQENKDDEVNKETAVSDSKQHIFISYNWDNQDMAVKIRDQLKIAQFQVWIDVDQMGGSTMEAMASAVENAWVVLILVSEKYKNSPNTRTEGEYTFQLKKPIIPLMLQRNYKPDGWLGLLMGSKFYINFDGKFPFDTAFNILLRELRGRNHDGVTATKEPALRCATQKKDTVDGHIHGAQNHEAWNWSKAQVSQWLSKNGFSNIPEFSKYDGSLLMRLNTVRLEAPDFFYKHLERTMKFNMLQILQFIKALDSLQ